MGHGFSLSTGRVRAETEDARQSDEEVGVVIQSHGRSLLSSNVQ
jgi:hypothetical protein